MRKDAYVKQLEDRVEELQDKYSSSEQWIPQWFDDGYGGCVFRSSRHHYGLIKPIAKSMFQVTFTNRTEVIVAETLDDAKRLVEQLSMKLHP